MPAEQETEAINKRDRGRILTCKELKQTSDEQRKVLRTCLDLLQNNKGCITAGEELIWNLLLGYGIRPLTPENVREDVEEFERNFEDMIETARLVNRLYPELVQPVGVGDKEAN